MQRENEKILDSLHLKEQSSFILLGCWHFSSSNKKKGKSLDDLDGKASEIDLKFRTPMCRETS